MAGKSKRFYEFGDFQIDTVNRRLRRAGEAVPLKAKAVETLLILLENKGDVVEKDDLMDRLWADSFVEEANLTQNVYTLRKALGDGFIETIPRRGYRFTADAKVWEEAADSMILIQEKTSMSISYEEESDAATEEKDGATKQIAAPQTAGKHHRRLAVAASLIILAAVAISVFFFLRASKPAFENARLAKLTTTGNILRASISPDGKHLAFVAGAASGQSLWIRQIAAGKDLQIKTTAKTDFYGLTFSHDGEYLYFVSQEMNRVGMLFRVPMLGGEPFKLAEDVDTPVTLSPDDKHLAFVRGSPEDHVIIVANADGTAERKLIASTPADSFVLAPEWKVPPAWSPDGKTIACAVGVPSPEGNYETIRGFDAETGLPHDLTAQRWETTGRAEWLADGSGLIITAAEIGTGFVQQIWHISASGETRKITNDLSDYQDLSITRDGKTLVAVQAERKANVSLAAMDNLSQITPLTAANYDGLNGLAFTPDDKIVYTRRVPGGQDLWIMDLQGGEPRALTSRFGFIIEPVVSPDNRYIVFTANRNGQSHIWRTDIDGRNPLELTHGVDDTTPTITADSQTIIYKARVAGKGSLYRVSINGGESARLSEKSIFEPKISPDGATLALIYRAAPAAPNKFATMPLNGGEPSVISDLPDYYGRFSWAPDGTALAYAPRQNPLGNIWLQPIDGSQPKQLTFWKPEPIFSFAFSGDGKKLTFASGSQTSDAVSIRSVR